MSEADGSFGADGGGAGAGGGNAGAGTAQTNGTAVVDQGRGDANARHAGWQHARDIREAGAQEPPKPQQQQKPAVEAGDDRKFEVGGGLSVSGAEIRQLLADRAAAVSARLARPQGPDAYKVQLPETFRPPEGLSFKFDEGDPLVSQARAWAHKSGLSQEQFAEGLALFASAKIGDLQTIVAARNNEIAKLGALGPSRFRAIETFLKAKLGESAGAQVAARICTASDVECFERLVSSVASQGGATYRATGREAPEAPGRASPEQIAKMSPAERLNYARLFDQKKMPEWQDPR